MEYISIKEVANIGGLTARMGLYHCTNGRIEGVCKISNVWIIPKDVARPEDGRNKIRRKSSAVKTKGVKA